MKPMDSEVFPGTARDLPSKSGRCAKHPLGDLTSVAPLRY
jgi:hypothetical protein